MTDEPHIGGADDDISDISETPGPDATPEQEAFVRGLLGSLAADDPGMPDDVVARIGTALALEARRGPVVAPDGPGGLDDDQADGGPRATAPDVAPVTVLPRQADRAGRPSRTFRWLAGAAAAVVVLVGGGAVVRQLGTGSDSSASTAGAASAEASDKTAGTLAATGTAYSRDTLATQVASLVTGIRAGRVATAATGDDAVSAPSVPSAGASTPPVPAGYTAAGLLTAATLPGCLEQLTGRTDVQPVAVDSGTYAGKLANVIVLRDDQDPAVYAVWVVGPLCTRDNADLIEWQSVPAAP